LQPVYLNNDHDNELIQLLSAGNRKAFRQLFDKYHKKVFSIALKITGVEETAEDVVQEVFIKLWLHKEGLVQVENFNAYLNTITRNHIFNGLRKIATEQMCLKKIAAQHQKQKNNADPVIYHELEILVSKAVGELSSQQKKVYQLSRIEGLKHEEIAERLGISSSTVKGHMVEALRHIKNVLHVNGELILLLLFAFTFLFLFL
jgi:RNA polymerase sigma-70 factor (ECF subfamily)